MLKGCRLPFHEGGEVDAQDASPVPEKNVVAHPLADGDEDAKLLLALPDQRLLLGFASLHLSARKFPLSGHLGRVRTFTCKHATVLNDGRPDDDPDPGGWGLG